MRLVLNRVSEIYAPGHPNKMILIAALSCTICGDADFILYFFFQLLKISWWNLDDVIFQHTPKEKIQGVRSGLLGGHKSFEIDRLSSAGKATLTVSGMRGQPFFVTVSRSSFQPLPPRMAQAWEIVSASSNFIELS